MTMPVPDGHVSPHAPVIEQAKGLVMGHYGVGPDAAFEMIRKWSRDGNRKVRDVCAALVAAAASDTGGAAPTRTTLDEALAAIGALGAHARPDA